MDPETVTVPEVVIEESSSDEEPVPTLSKVNKETSIDWEKISKQKHHEFMNCFYCFGVYYF